MNTEKWKWRSSTIGTASLAPHQYTQTQSRRESPDPTEGRKPRGLTKALRSLSSSSLDSMSGATSKNAPFTRKPHKTSSSASMIGRLQKRVSRESSISASPSECPDSPLEQPFASMEVIRYGWLRTDVSRLNKARSEYLVLTDHSLVKFGSSEAARSVFPQLSQIENHAQGAPLPQSMNGKSAAPDIRLDVPLRSIIAVFHEEASPSRFGIEVWWFSQSPKLAYCKAHFFFALPKERDDWLEGIQHAYKAKLRKNPGNSAIPDNLKIRIHHAIQAAENPADGGSQNLIFPVARRTIGSAQKGAAVDDSQELIDISSFYLAIGPCMCYFIEVLKADHSTLPGELRMKVMTFGTVTLTRFRASVASYEQRFAMNFRLPFGRETRLDLASTCYRRIIEALTKLDRVLKPMWPQNLQHAIFEIKGLPPPLQLTSGNDLGGLEMSLQAYCVAFHVQIPTWKIEWNTSSQPAFRLLPSDGTGYSPLQLLAVFRALRYNSFFKGISFRDVDLSPLAGENDYTQHGDSVVYTSLGGQKIPEDYYEVLLQAPILEQEIHALMFASASIRSVDFTNVVGLLQLRRTQSYRASINHTGMRKMSSEIIRPVLMLLRSQLCHCHSISMSGNPVAPGDVDELANLLMQDNVCMRKIELANCGLADAGLTKLWTGLAGQAETLKWLDTSDNQGTVKFDTIHHTLAQLRNIKNLNIAGNTRLDSEESLFLESTINSWSLQELDLSGIILNDATVDVIAGYMETSMSQSLQVIRLNNCGLTGSQVARLFRSIGRGRHLTIHVNSNRLDEGIDDLCGAIAHGYGPWSLFMQMIEFGHEASYIKLLQALTVNKTIECLSLAGSATPDAVSSVACQAVSDFFANNETIRFLDISGYDSKLDEGRLGREFSKALSGLRANKRIEHLRVRSQMLNINIGGLAEAISGNKTLHTLDCEGNNFNLSNFWYLVKRMDSNTTIRHFSPFSEQELAQTTHKSVESDLPAAQSRRTSVIAKFRHDNNSNSNNNKGQMSYEELFAQKLRDEWVSALAALQQTLERNQGIHQEKCESGNAAADQVDGEDGNREGIFSIAFGGLASREYESRTNSPRPLTPVSKPSPEPLVISNLQTTSDEFSDEVMRYYTMVSSEITSSPTTDGTPTPPEMESPAEKDLGWGNYVNAEALYDEVRDDHDGDRGLQMGRYRRFLGDPTSRIEEEDDRSEGEKGFDY